jgi:hypothetical protein
MRVVFLYQVNFFRFLYFRVCVTPENIVMYLNKYFSYLYLTDLYAFCNSRK